MYDLGDILVYMNTRTRGRLPGAVTKIKKGTPKIKHGTKKLDKPIPKFIRRTPKYNQEETKIKKVIS